MSQLGSSNLTTLGLSMTTALFLAACGGADEAAPSASGSATDGTPTSEQPKIIQPAWGSWGVLVQPGDASKVFTWPTGCSGEGVASGTLYDASLTVLANGDVSFKAASTQGGEVKELYSLKLEDTSNRQFNLQASNELLTYARYSMNPKDSKATISLTAGEGESFSLNHNDLYVYCSAGPITLASLTPVIAFLPSETRISERFTDGVTEVNLNRDDVSKIFNGAFYWSQQSEQPASAATKFGASSVSFEPSGPFAASSLNLANGQLFDGMTTDLASGFASTPAATRVTYTSALKSGSYQESYSYGVTDLEPPALPIETRSVDLQIRTNGANSMEMPTTRTYKLKREQNKISNNGQAL